MASFMFAGAAMAGESLWCFFLMFLGCVFGAAWQCILEEQLRKEMEDSRK